MRSTLLLLISVVFVAALTTSCGDESPTSGSLVGGELSPGGLAPEAGIQEVPVFLLPDFSPAGKARLVRDDNGMSVNVKGTGLEPGAAMTMWWIVINNPSACSDGVCGGDDFGNVAADIDIGYATGNVVGGAGMSNFSARLNNGDSLEGFPAFFGITSGSGLADSRVAEVWLILHSHGPLIPEIANEMLSTFNAGCPGLPDEFGTPGPNTCQDTHIAIFAAP